MESSILLTPLANPARGNLSVEIAGVSSGVITVLDICGRTVLTGEVPGDGIFSLGELPAPGIFIIRLIILQEKSCAELFLIMGVFKMIAICGLDCEECPARLAYLNDDDELREKTALEWSGLYGADIKPEQVNCTGCTVAGIKFPHCENGCFMRKCAMGKALEHCGMCTEYPCEELSAFFAHVPSAKENLDKLIG